MIETFLPYDSARLSGEPGLFQPSRPDAPRIVKRGGAANVRYWTKADIVEPSKAMAD
jgi:hypothetical protein